MIWIVLVILLIIIIIVAMAKLAPPKQQATTEFEYQKIEALFTPAERSFLGTLTLAVNDDIKILGKVRVADVITPKKSSQRAHWQKAFNKISAKHFDFLLCKKDDLSPICAIELNDSSHKNKKRAERDVFLANACHSTGLPLIQITAKATYTLSEIKTAISIGLAEITLPEAITIEQSPQLKVMHEEDLHEKETHKKEVLVKKVTSEKLCPKCSSPMSIKIAKKGKNSGNEFWACSTFPACRHIETKIV